MQKNNVTCLRQTLEHMSTQQLDDMLHKELNSECPNSQNVRLILKVLQDRESDEMPLGPATEAAWAEYLMKTGKPESESPQRRMWILRIASVVVIVAFLLAILPQETSANNIFSWFFNWTDSILELIDADDSGSFDDGYVFATDHPGLQQVYDFVTAQGISQPVVPMWLPEGYELAECKVTQNPAKDVISVTFINGANEICMRINVYANGVSSAYFRTEDVVKNMEINGVTHTLTKNNDKWTAVWVKENIECSIFADCQEDTLQTILKSIYTMEDD